MYEITVINEYTSRMCLSYKDIFTTVYAVKTEEGALLFDAATFESDITEHISPMLTSLGIGRDDLKYIFVSHNHTDHAGGVPYLAALYPNATVLTRSPQLVEKYPELNIKMMKGGDTFLGCLSTVEIPGHSADSTALYDSRTRTLITGDSLQLYGIFGSQDWGSNIGLPAEHLAALIPVYEMDIEEIHSAHDFHPYGIAFVGREMVHSALDACREPLLKMRDLIKANPEKSDAEIRLLYNASANIPPVREGVFKNVRLAITEGKM